MIGGVEKLINDHSGFADGFLKLLGSTVYDSIDASSYENATIIHDMNLPIKTDLFQKYSVVIDGGSLEHIFNFPVAIKNAMNLVTLSGHYIGISPCNNMFGHGFYQFSPELFFRVLSPSNGFEIEKIIFYNDEKYSTWF